MPHTYGWFYFWPLYLKYLCLRVSTPLTTALHYFLAPSHLNRSEAGDGPLRYGCVWGFFPQGTFSWPLSLFQCFQWPLSAQLLFHGAPCCEMPFVVIWLRTNKSWLNDSCCCCRLLKNWRFAIVSRWAFLVCTSEGRCTQNWKRKHWFGTWEPAEPRVGDIFFFTG